MSGADYKTAVFVPQVKDHALAVALFYGQTEISTKDITAIFGVSPSTAAKLKARAREEMAANHTPSWNPRMVNTEDAYRSWGIDVSKMERATKKLRFGTEETK